MKKVFMLLLVALLIVGSIGPMTYASDAITYGNALQILGIIKGDATGNLNGSKALTRGELVAIISTLTTKSNDTFKAPTKATFSDVPTTHWAYKHVERAKANNVTSGLGNGKFGVNDKVTYKQAQAFMLNMLGYKVDWSLVGDYAYEIGLTSNDAEGATLFTRDMMFEILVSTLIAPTNNAARFIEVVIANGFLGLSEDDIEYLFFVHNTIAFNSEDFTGGPDPGEVVDEPQMIVDMSKYKFDSQIPVLTDEDQLALGSFLTQEYIRHYNNVTFSASNYKTYFSLINDLFNYTTFTSNVPVLDDETQTYNNFAIVSTMDGNVTLELADPDLATVKFVKTTLKINSVWKSNGNSEFPSLSSYVLNLEHPQDSSITIKYIITFDKDLYTWNITIMMEGV